MTTVQNAFAQGDCEMWLNGLDKLVSGPCFSTATSLNLHTLPWYPILRDTYQPILN